MEIPPTAFQSRTCIKTQYNLTGKQLGNNKNELLDPQLPRSGSQSVGWLHSTRSVWTLDYAVNVFL